MKTKILFCVLFLLSSCSVSRKVEKHEESHSVSSISNTVTSNEQLKTALAEYLRTHAYITIKREREYSEPQQEPTPPPEMKPNKAPTQNQVLVSENTEINIDFSQDKNTEREEESNNECSSDSDSFSKSESHSDKKSDTDAEGYIIPKTFAIIGLLLLLVFVYKKNQ